MYDRNLDNKGNKLNQASEMYDLSLDRRAVSRRNLVKLPTRSDQVFERRYSDRRRDNRPLNEFPYLP